VNCCVNVARNAGRRPRSRARPYVKNVLLRMAVQFEELAPPFDSEDGSRS
jgi:hypothetical protein